jgi:hypothetical protein
LIFLVIGFIIGPISTSNESFGDTCSF